MTLDELATSFKYTSEKRDTWRILSLSDCRGDCDDYACTALYIVKGSLWAFWVALIFGSAKIHFVTTHTGGGHAVLGYNGMYIDNWSRKFVTKEYMQNTLGHRFDSWRFPFWATASKMLCGKLWGAKG